MPPMTSLDLDGALFEALRPRLTAISRRIVGCHAEAEDIVQDCFITWRRSGGQALHTPAAWLTTVVRNRSIDRLRKRARDAAAAQLAMALAPAEPPAAADAMLLRHAALDEALARMLVRLSPAERIALVLREVFECEHAVIAAALGTKAVNARQYLARARRRLRDDQEASAANEKLCRDLVRQFQAALNGRDVAAMVTLLADEQPVSVHASPNRARACANDALYRVPRAA